MLRRWGILVLIGVAVTLALPVHAYAALNFSETTVSASQSASYENADVDGNLVAWEWLMGGSSTAKDVWVKDLASGALTNTAEVAGDQKRPEIDGGLVVWQDYRIASNEGDLWAYNAATRTRTRLTDTTSDEDEQSLDGQRLVWHTYGYGHHGMWTKKLGSSEPTQQLYSYNTQYAFTSVRGDRLVFNQLDTAGDWRVVSHGLSTGVDATISPVGMDARYPRTSGDAWNGWTLWDGEGPLTRLVYMYDHVTGAVEPVSSNPPTFRPDVAGNKAAWCEKPSGQPYRLIVDDLLNGAVKEVATSTQPFRNPRIDGKRVVFAQDRGPWDGVYVQEWTCTADRVSGASRYAIAANAAAKAAPGWANVEHVVVASGADAAAADPLAAAGLCWAYSSSTLPPDTAPLLLTSPTALPAETAAALTAIKAANPGVIVHVVGGTGSVPEARLAQMRTIVGTGNVERLLSTGNRYDMAHAIADRMVTVRGGEMDAGHVLFANGADPAKFFDALALGAISRGRGYPILLVGKDVVPAATKSAHAMLKAHDPSLIGIIGGGTGTVSNAVRVQLGVSSGNRWYGADRYSTAAAIADKAQAQRYANCGHVAVAASMSEALAAASMVGATQGVLLLSAPASLPSATASYLTRHRSDVWDCAIVGSTATVSTGVKNSINSRLR